MRIATLVVVVQCVVLAGCVGEAGSEQQIAPTGSPVSTGSSAAQPLTAVPFAPAFSGHHLAVLGDVAIVLDPEGSTDDGQHPQIFLVSLTDRGVLATLALPAGANPQAVVVASDNNVYVVVTGLGGVYPIDVAHQTLGEFSSVCEAPVDAAANGPNLVVACLSGELVTMTAQGVTSQSMGVGLSRVAVDPLGHVFVATQSAQVIQVDSQTKVTPATVALPALNKRTAVPTTPRRLIPLPTGGVAMLYQQSMTGELTDTGTMDPPTDGSTTPPPDGSSSGGSYTGGSDMCAVPATRPVMTQVLPNGQIGTQRWVLGTLPIDAAASPDGTLIAIADASGGNVLLSRTVDLSSGAPDDTCFANTGQNNPEGLTPDAVPTATGVTLGAPIAVAFFGSTLVVLNAKATLELATITIDETGGQSETGGRMSLRSRSPSDGFTLFHQDPTLFSVGTPVPLNPLSGFPHTTPSRAASCRDGLTTGATTTILGVTHRVMPLANHVKNAPLVHWDGLAFHDAVVTHTWEQNMGGAALAGSEASLRSFVESASDARASRHHGRCDL